jgi:hypothetical protein
MGHITSIGRVSGFAVALGIGAALATSPLVAGVAGASPNEVHASANADTHNPKEQNLAISHNGVQQVQKGNAIAISSGIGSKAYARGFKARAEANGAGNTAHADGIAAVAIAGDQPGDVNNHVTVNGDQSSATALGNGNTLTVAGDGSRLFVQGGSNNATIHGNNNKFDIVGDANDLRVNADNQGPQTITGNGQKVCLGKGCH